MKKKDLKFKNNVRSLALIALGVITIGTGTTVLASTTWKANTPESIKIVDGQNSYTMVEGDTLWAIGMKINVNVETLSAINNINLSNGEEYHLAVGTIIKWDKSGNLIAQTPNGNQVNQGIKVEDSNKIIPSKPIGSDVTGDVIENNIPDDQIQGGNEVEVKPVEPTTPVKPIEPTNPVDPVKPVDPTTPTDPVDPKPPVQKNIQCGMKEEIRMSLILL
ncbi:LysM peptidoglycan-binding domain-containing protein [Vagococcus fluvialis]|uniref:LysM peptidoglycan-binding domain-containing protein n=1 Tax=Vagococcus fluvialis TaxID=2738 RepID=UPI003D0F41FC